MGSFQIPSSEGYRHKVIFYNSKHKLTKSLSLGLKSQANPQQENLPTYLAPRSPTAILPALLKACVPVCANDPVIQTSSIYVSHGIFCICS